MASVAKREWTYNGEKKSAWIVRYFDGKGVQRQKTFEKKKDADRYRTVVEVELGDGTHMARSEAKTVRFVAEEFLRAAEDRLRNGQIGRGTLNNIQVAINRSILPRLGARKIVDLSISDLDEFYSEMCREDGLKPATGKTRLRVFKMVCRFGIRRGYLKFENVTHVLSDVRGTGDAVRTFSEDQMRHLFRAAELRVLRGRDRTHLLLRCSVYLAALCGLRYGEIMGLTSEDVDLAARIIKVRHGLTEYDELKEPKTRSGMRDVPMPGMLAELIEEWVRRFYVSNPRKLLFRSPSGGIIGASNFHTLVWKPLLARAGLEDLKDAYHFHALRHFAASWWISRGLGIMEVASLMGHRTFNTTLQTYAHPVVGGNRRQEMMETISSDLLLNIHRPPTIEHDPAAHLD